MPAPAALLAVAALLAAGALGCGVSEREADAAAVAERFHSAIGERDGEAACAVLSEETASKLEQQEGAPCEEAVLSLELPGGGEAAVTSVWVRTSASR